MANGPAPFSEIGKRARDLLYKDYNFDHKFTLTVPSSSGLGLAATGLKKDKFFVGDINTLYKSGNDFFSEDEIRVRSNEILENEDMQHLLRLFSMGGHASMNTEDSYSFPSFMPSPMPNFDEDRSRPGRAVVGWLKIKAAMRWGFFIRKIAAEKRAQIEEIDE